ncbi:MAG: hypothetical protein KF708_01645 [Pirellulales bacterium]|nr:hypothetical protein [Pirellulales bacterium]
MWTMVFEQIEQLKQQYTDKYVVVDATRPELARFRDRTGQVKTVNMSGRALVQFDGGDNNIGWFDIGLDFLKVVDKPLPKVAEEKPARETKPAAPAKSAGSAAHAPVGAKKPSVAEMARSGGAAKQSTADILAAARGKAAAPKAEAVKAEAPAAAPKPAAATAPKGKLSTADILAAARGKAVATAAPAAPAKPAPAPEPEPAPVEEPVAETAVEEAPAPVPAAAPAKAAKGSLPKATPEIIAWCRDHDTK